MQLDNGELGGPGNGDQQVELALRGVDLGDVDVEVAEGIGLEFAFGWRGSLDIGQAGDAGSLEAAMQGCWGSCGTVACRAYKQSSSGRRVWRRKATTIASSSTESTAVFSRSRHISGAIMTRLPPAWATAPDCKQ